MIYTHFDEKAFSSIKKGALIKLKSDICYDVLLFLEDFRKEEYVRTYNITNKCFSKFKLNCNSTFLHEYIQVTLSNKLEGKAAIFHEYVLAPHSHYYNDSLEILVT